MEFESYKQAVKQLNGWATAYYTLDAPTVTDDEYDRLYREVRKFEEQNPDKLDPASPTQRVGGAVLEEFEKARHLEQMYSLEDIFDYGELTEWVERIHKTQTDVSFVCEPKFDGASLNLLYENGNTHWFHSKRIDNPNTHGTGCTLSSAIASNLAKGYDLDTAVERAKAYISGALAAMLDLGHGSGPMDHGFDFRGKGFAEEQA